MTTPFPLPALDFDLTTGDASAWRVADGALEVSAPAHTDLFVDPSGATGDSGVAAESMLNAVTLLGDPGDGDFQLSARVTVGFRGTYDAGVLLLWSDERTWAKLCFERSPHAEHMVVSVVTRDTSDDANGFVVDGDTVHLRVSRIGRVFAFHASTDGARWSFVRAFTLGDAGLTARVGFEGQSPVGDGCSARFDDIRFERRTLGDLRDGS